MKEGGRRASAGVREGNERMEAEGGTMQLLARRHESGMQVASRREK